MFEPPLQYCAVIGQYVAVDEPQQDCRRVHQCDPDWTCFVFPPVADREPRTIQTAAVERKSAD